jgi:hypothetical protein
VRSLHSFIWFEHVIDLSAGNKTSEKTPAKDIIEATDSALGEANRPPSNELFQLSATFL